MARAAGSGVSVLVIDDDAVMRELLPMLLEAEGYTVAVAETATEALAMLAEAKPAVILTDLHLPRTDIGELLPQLKAAGTVLLAMSASKPEPQVLEMLDEFLAKPFGAAEFQVAVARARTLSSMPQSGETVGAETSAPGLGNSPNQSDGGIPVLDLDVYHRLAASLPVPALGQLYELTLDDVRARGEAMRAAFAANDTAMCRSEAHAMKGGCGMVGALELRAIGAAMEAGAPADTPRLEEIAAACERLRRMLVTLS